MTALTSIKDLTKLLRQYLILTSDIDEKLVRNSLSMFGAELNKSNNDVIFDSVEPDDLILIYELRTRDSDSNVSMTIDDDLEYYRSFTLHCIIYGDQSMMSAQKIISRFRSDQIRTLLQGNGCYVSSVSEPTFFNEFINGMMRIRTDFDIEISCKFIFTQVYAINELTKLNDIHIEEV